MKGFIFDLDGVLLSTDELHYQAWKKVADKLGIPFDRTINDRLRGVSREASLEIILEKYDGRLSAAEKEDLCNEKNEYYKELIHLASKLEGLPRQSSLHAAGIIINNTPLSQSLPTIESEGKNQ